uniref:Uncharacterized protein n=1 Tax=Romanomermis culicivorax TaxID=13658 RepID=A0A915JNS3_ROMCU
MRCGPGTVYNAYCGYCDWPYVVKCKPGQALQEAESAMAGGRSIQVLPSARTTVVSSINSDTHKAERQVARGNRSNAPAFHESSSGNYKEEDRVGTSSIQSTTCMMTESSDLDYNSKQVPKFSLRSVSDDHDYYRNDSVQVSPSPSGKHLNTAIIRRSNWSTVPVSLKRDNVKKFQEKNKKKKK